MARLQLHQVPPHKRPIALLRPFAVSAAVFGVGVGTYALFFLSVTPLVKRGFLSQLPVVGSYWEDKIPASDKPF